jgi:acetoin utilization deacetylase AcuC-like enzyme
MTTGFHIHSRYASHVTPAAHPERPERILRLLELEERLDAIGVTPFPSERRATRDELERVHDAAYVDAIADTDGEDTVMLDPDTYTSPDSYTIALHAAGALLDLVDAVMEGRLDNAFAAVRPPGHHAEADRAMGFCLFNNIAVAARHLTERHGLERVLVVDYDVHHGNGTQHTFYHDPRVLFVSLHQYPFYPGTGAAEDTGAGDGTGYTVNVPFPAGHGDSDYHAAFDRLVIPIARRFAPEFVLISAGFDAHWADPLANMQLSDDAFASMTARLLDVAAESASGRCVATLEGGYNADALVSCVEAVLGTMANPAASAPQDADDTMAETLIAHIASLHTDKWGL